MRQTPNIGGEGPCSLQPCVLKIGLSWCERPTAPRATGEVMAMAIFLAITAAFVCCALCAYAIYAAVGRSRERRAAANVH